MGFVPNLMATMAKAPALVESHMTMMAIFEKTDLTPAECEIILMTNNRLNGCTYCMAAHTTVAKMAGVDADVIEALRTGRPIADPKPEVLRAFAIIIDGSRGWATEGQVDALVTAGDTKQTVLEVITGTALKVLSNYTTHNRMWQVMPVFADLAELNQWLEDRCIALWAETSHKALPGSIADGVDCSCSPGVTMRDNAVVIDC